MGLFVKSPEEKYQIILAQLSLNVKKIKGFQSIANELIASRNLKKIAQAGIATKKAQELIDKSRPLVKKLRALCKKLNKPIPPFVGLWLKEGGQEKKLKRKVGRSLRA